MALVNIKTGDSSGIKVAEDKVAAFLAENPQARIEGPAGHASDRRAEAEAQAEPVAEAEEEAPRARGRARTQEEAQ